MSRIAENPFFVLGLSPDASRIELERKAQKLLGMLELGFAVYFLLAIAYSARLHMWGTIPFLLLFFFGFGYMGVMSLLQTASGKRLAALWRPLKT